MTEAAKESPALMSYRILLVDDSDADLVTYRRLLRQQTVLVSACHTNQCQIVEATTGEEALTCCLQAMPDAIVMDYRLPDMTGLELLAALKQQQGQETLPVVMVTGQGNTDIAVAALKGGAMDYLEKSRIGAESLHRAVYTAVQQGQLRRALQKQQQQQQLLTQTALQIRQSLTLTNILQQTVDAVRQSMGCDRVLIYQFAPDWSGQVVAESVGADWGAILGQVIHDPCLEYGWAETFRQGKTTYHDDIADAGLDPCYVNLMQRFQVQANLSVPLLSDQQVWGLLLVHHCRAPRQWQPEDVDFLLQLATQVSIAIQQAALVERLQSQLQERHATEAALQDSEARFRTIVEAEPECVKVLTLDGRLQSMNPAGLAMIEADSLDLLRGQNVCQLVVSDQQPLFLDFLQQVAAGNSDRLEFEIIGLKGTRRWLESHAVLMAVPGSETPHILAITRDITDRKQMERSLRENEEKLHLLIQHAPASIAMFDREMHYIMASQRWVDDYRLGTVASIIGRLHYDVLPDMPDRWREGHQRCLAGAIEKCDDDLFERGDGRQQWVRWEVRPWYTGDAQIGGIIIFAEDITERKQVEITLRENETRLQLAQIASNSAVWDWDIAANTLFWSPEYYQLYQLDLTLEPSFENWIACLHPDDQEGVAQHIQSVLATGVSNLRVEFRVIQAQGVRWFAGIGQIFRDAANKPTRMLGITIDITQQKQSEVALQQLNQELEQRVNERTRELSATNDRLQQELIKREQAQQALQVSEATLQLSEERLQLALEAAGDGLWDWNITTGDFYVSPRWLKMLGFEVGDLPAHISTWEQLVHPDDAFWVMNILNSHLHDDTVAYKFDYRVRTRSGRYKWVANYGKVVMRDPQGNPLRMTGTHRDISDRKQYEESLMRLAAIVESSEDAIVGESLERVITSWNAAAERMFGYTAAEVVGQPNSILYPPGHVDDMELVLQRILRGETIDHYETMRQRKDGQKLVVSITVSPIRDAVGRVIGVSTITRDITAQRLMQQTLELQSVIMNNMAGGVCMVSEIDWTIVYTNPKFAALFGYDPNELQGRSANILYCDTRTYPTEQGIREMNQRVKVQDEASYEVYNVKKDGTPFWCWAHTTLFDHPNYGRVYVTVQDDITDRKQAEAALERELLRSKALYRASFDGIVTLNQQGEVVEASQSFAEMLGYTLDEILTLHVSDWNAQWSGAELITNLQQSTRKDSTFETRHRRKNGSVYDVEISTTEVHLDTEVLILCICRDISARKRTEATLRESDRRWRSLLDNVQLIVVGLDCDGNIEYANPFLCKLTDYSQPEVIGKNWMQTFIPNSHQANIQTTFQEFLEHNFHIHYQNSILTRAGDERVIDWSNTLLRDPAGHEIGTISIGEDITERYKLEQMKSEFISVVSHELRTPLTSMQAALSLLVENIIDPTTPEGQDVLQIASVGVDRLVRLVNDILDLERLEFGKIRLEKHPCDTSDLVEMAVGQMQEMANQVGITLQVESLSFPVHADSDRLLQVLTNLLSNAIKFSFSGGAVTLSVKQLVGSTPPCLQFTIQDQGRGIPTDKLECVFERFQQVDASDSREKGGTGLGLAICRSIVQQHGGQIWAESVLGQGSTFSFTLPTE